VGPQNSLLGLCCPLLLILPASNPETSIGDPTAGQNAQTSTFSRHSERQKKLYHVLKT
jgi:hypothetical protein